MRAAIRRRLAPPGLAQRALLVLTQGPTEARGAAAHKLACRAVTEASATAAAPAVREGCGRRAHCAHRAATVWDVARAAIAIAVEEARVAGAGAAGGSTGASAAAGQALSAALLHSGEQQGGLAPSRVLQAARAAPQAQSTASSIGKGDGHGHSRGAGAAACSASIGEAHSLEGSSLQAAQGALHALAWRRARASCLAGALLCSSGHCAGEHCHCPAAQAEGEGASRAAATGAAADCSLHPGGAWREGVIPQRAQHAAAVWAAPASITHAAMHPLCVPLRIHAGRVGQLCRALCIACSSCCCQAEAAALARAGQASSAGAGQVLAGLSTEACPAGAGACGPAAAASSRALCCHRVHRVWGASAIGDPGWARGAGALRAGGPCPALKAGAQQSMAACAGAMARAAAWAHLALHLRRQGQQQGQSGEGQQVGCSTHG